MTEQQTNGSSAGDGNGAEATRSTPTFIPPADIIETEQDILMLLDMPGADPGSLDVTLEQRVLRISARTDASTPEGYALVRAEYRDGAYERSFSISEPINTEAIDATFRDGVLRLTLPKAAPSPAAKINVQSA